MKKLYVISKVNGSPFASVLVSEAELTRPACLAVILNACLANRYDEAKMISDPDMTWGGRYRFIITYKHRTNIKNERGEIISVTVPAHLELQEVKMYEI